MGCRFFAGAAAENETAGEGQYGLHHGLSLIDSCIPIRMHLAGPAASSTEVLIAMALVFQYGSNTSSTRLNSDKRLRGDASDLGLARTQAPFELDFDSWSTTNACAAANILEGGSRRIWGVLYEVPDYLIRRETAGKRTSLDAIEGPNYERRPIQLQRPDGTPVVGEVITYRVVNRQPGLRTSMKYASHIMAGLREHGAPDECLAYVKARVIANNPDLAAQIGFMETLAEQFKQALSRIEIGQSKLEGVQKAHQEVRTELERSDQLREWGINTILIGSYSRSTGIYPGKDVDIFSKLEKLNTEVSTEQVFRVFAGFLKGRYGDRATLQNRSVRIGFEAYGFSADVVPAVRAGVRWAVPSRDQSGWIETDPERLGDLTHDRNKSPKIGGRGAYVPVVKLVRQIREHHLGATKPGGLIMEMATYWAFENGASGESFAAILANTLGFLAQELAAAPTRPILDPALETPYSPAPTSAEFQAAAALFERLAVKADEALQAKRCPAAVLWREILGSNGRGSCLPLPPGCDEKGREIAGITAVTDSGPDEARPFA